MRVMSDESAREAVGDYRYGFHDPENATIRFDKGLSEQVVRDISELKNEPEWSQIDKNGSILLPRAQNKALGIKKRPGL